MENENNLKSLRIRESMTQNDFAVDNNLSLSTIKRYERGATQIPIDTALTFTKKYHVTLDWLYCKDNHYTGIDTMAQVINALGNIFSIEIKRYIPKDKKEDEIREPVLVVDSRFRKFLDEIKDLELLNTWNKITQLEYPEKREEIYNRHKKYLKSIFTDVHFNKEEALVLYGVYDDDDFNPVLII